MPKGYEELIAYLGKDQSFRRQLFKRIKLIFYAAASLSQPVWDDLERLAMETCGDRIAMLSAYGSTETARFAMSPLKPSRTAGHVGVPGPGVQLVLVPTAEKLEPRVRGPNVTLGYWKHPELTRAV